MTQPRTLIITAFLIIALPSCSLLKPARYVSDESRWRRVLSDSTLKLNASAGPLDVSSARFLANSGTAQAEKLELIGAAGRKIIFSALDFGADGAALRLADKLLAAARRGAEVQLLLDFTRSYAQLDLLIALEQAGNLGR